MRKKESIVRSGSFTTTIDLEDGTEVEVVVSYEAHYEPARICGLPEDCSPADGDIDELSCFCEDDKLRSSPEFQAAVEDHGDRLADLAWDHFMDNRS